MFTEKVRGLSVARVSGAGASAPPTKTPIIDVDVDWACGQERAGGRVRACCGGGGARAGHGGAARSRGEGAVSG